MPKYQTYKNGTIKLDDDGNGIFVNYDCNLDPLQQSETDYEGGKCAFTDNNCEPQGNFDFLRLYYCDFEAGFGKAKLYLFIPVGVSNFILI